jgi:hypothetical protein
MSRFGLVLVAGLWTAAPALAGSWVDGMFAELSKDFGSVPRGPSLAHSFLVKNNSDRPVHIQSVGVSCGCVSAHAAQDTLAPGESTVIQAQMDTRIFHGIRNVTIFVRFDQPSSEEVRLWVQANSRDDISVNPEELTFGRIHRGTVPAAVVSITLLGDGFGTITEVQRESNYVQTQLKELSREGGQARYQLTASIRGDAPAGKWYSDIWLKTDNAAIPRIRVPLTVEIESALAISPSTVILGQVKPGAEAERKLIVRGVKPFKITKVQGTDEQVVVTDSTADSKPVHVLTVKIKPKKTGELNRRLKVVTDLKEDGEIEFEAQARVQ